MIFQKSTLISLLVLATAISGLNANSFNGCVSANSNGKCDQCLERKVLIDGNGCGPLQPTNDTCLIYGYNGIFKRELCNVCKTGYANKLIFDGGNVTQSCIPGTIQGCLLEEDVTLGKLNETICEACPNNTYSVLNLTTKTSTCQNITNPIANCKWGAAAIFNEIQCSRCNDGYAIDALTRKCATTVETGCWVQLKGKCTACNPFEGYSINGNGTCFKTTTFRGAQQDAIQLLKDTLSKLRLGF